MKGNEMDMTFAFERDLRGWLGAADPGGAPVSMRMRIAADLRAEAEAGASSLSWLRTLGGRFAPLANVAGLAFTVALLAIVASIATRIGAAGPGAPAPTGVDLQAPGQADVYGFEGISMPIAALICVVAGALAWAAAATARFRTISDWLFSLEFPDRDAGGVVMPRLQTVPGRVWAVVVGVIAIHVFLIASTNIAEMNLPTGSLIEQLIQLGASTVQTLILVTLLIRYRRLWRADPLLLGGSFVCVVATVGGDLAWRAAIRVFGSPIPFEAMEFVWIAANLAFVAFVIGVARRAGVRVPPSRILLGTGIGLSCALAIGPYMRFPLYPVSQVLSIVASVVYIAGWLLLAWVGINVWRSNRFHGRVSVVLITGAGIFEIAALVGQRLRAFFPAEWLTLSLSGSADSTMFGVTANWTDIVPIALATVAAAGWVLLLLAAVIGLPRTDRAAAALGYASVPGAAHTR